MSRSNGGWPRLPLSALSDTELLTLFSDAADAEDGGATAVEVAERTNQGIRAARSLGCRFAWFARWGYMEQDERTKRWYLTPEGGRLRDGIKLSAAERRALERASTRALGVGDLLGTALDRDAHRMLRRALRHHEFARG
jgi:hypothetical protein